jgi:serine/threonine-protein kinase
LIGKTLSHYRVVEKLGEGGMGEVYRATDTKLGRDVALKILPGAFASDAERMARFEREARLLASLNHPNIATIYGLEEAEGVRCLVLELVEGPTLADRVARAPLALDEALPIAWQIAQALEAAHDKDIIHRDLKPANVKVKEDGAVKVLDFGLAKALESEASTAATDSSPTISALATSTGAFLGTAAYMSPEQVRSARVDKRADIWAYGAVLFELLTGQRPFYHRALQDTLAAILRSEPDWEALPADTPAGLRKLLHRCLEKDPNRRLHDIADARLEIEDALQPPADDQKPAATAAPRAGWQRFVPWVVAGVLAAALVAVLLVPRAPVESPGRSARLSINLPAEAPLAPASAMPLGVGRSSLALSPEGSLLVYVAFVNGETKLYLREMDSGEFRQIPGTEGAHSPFFSPDGNWVGFFAHDKLKKVPLAGGDPITLCNATLGFGGSWAQDDTIYFSTDYSSGVNKVAVAGGEPEVVTVWDQGTPHLLPHILPGEKGILFSSEWGATGVHDFRTGQTKILVRQGTFPHYSSTGHIIFAGRGTIQAAPFDLDSLELTGPPALLVEGVRTERDGAAQFAFAQDGTFIFGSGPDATMGSLVWIDHRGRTTPLGAPAGDYHSFRISPDGEKVALPIMGAAGRDIWLYDIQRGTTTRLTFDEMSVLPVWSPNSRELYFGSWRSGVTQIYRKKDDGSSDAEVIAGSRDGEVPGSISPDGKWLLTTMWTPETKSDVWMLPLTDEDRSSAPAAKAPLLGTSFNEVFPAPSPDGRWLAYTSDESGGWEVYVRSFPGPGGKTRISTDGGEEPIWSSDGRQLYYRIGSRWFVVDVTLGESFTATRPRLLFEGPFINIGGLSYDVTPDGQRFLVVEGPEQTKTLTELTVITNFFDELNRLAPAE